MKQRGPRSLSSIRCRIFSSHDASIVNSIKQRTTPNWKIRFRCQSAEAAPFSTALLTIYLEILIGLTAFPRIAADVQADRKGNEIFIETSPRLGSMVVDPRRVDALTTQIAQSTDGDDDSEPRWRRRARHADCQRDRVLLPRVESRSIPKDALITRHSCAPTHRRHVSSRLSNFRRNARRATTRASLSLHDSKT